MIVQIQGGKRIIDCKSAGYDRDYDRNLWFIHGISPITGKETGVLGYYHSEEQCNSILYEIRDRLCDSEKKHQPYFMPKDDQAINGTSISFDDLNLGR